MYGKPPGTTVDLFISLLKMLFGLVLQKEDKMPKKAIHAQRADWNPIGMMGSVSVWSIGSAAAILYKTLKHWANCHTFSQEKYREQIYLSITCLSIYLYTCLSIYLFICLVVCSSIHIHKYLTFFSIKTRDITMAYPTHCSKSNLYLSTF